MEKTLSNKLSNEEYEALIAKTFQGKLIKEKTIVSGKVVSIENDLVTIDVGSKSEGRIPVSEFHRPGQKPEMKIGDSFDVFIENVDNSNGETILSREKAIKQEVWKRIEDCLNNDSILKGLITGSVKGGMTVDVQGIKAFLPGSLAEGN